MNPERIDRAKENVIELYELTEKSYWAFFYTIYMQFMMGMDKNMPISFMKHKPMIKVFYNRFVLQNEMLANNTILIDDYVNAYNDTEWNELAIIQSTAQKHQILSWVHRKDYYTSLVPLIDEYDELKEKFLLKITWDNA